MDRYTDIKLYFITMFSGCEYSVFMSCDELSDTNNNGRLQKEPSLTQMLHALLADCEEERFWERVCYGQELAQLKEERKIQLNLMKALMEGIPPGAFSKAIIP